MRLSFPLGLGLLFAGLLPTAPLSAEDQVIIDGDKITIIGSKDVASGNTKSESANQAVDQVMTATDEWEKNIRDKKAYQAEVQMAQKNKQRRRQQAYKEAQKVRKAKRDEQKYQAYKSSYRKARVKDGVQS